VDYVLDFIASINRMIGGLEMIWPSRSTALEFAWAEGKPRKPSGEPLSRPRFERSTSKIKV
jgi:hypothetical protein